MAAVMVVMSLVAGFFVFCCGIREAFVQHRLKREGTRVRGLVVRHHASTGPSGGGRFPVVEFVDAQGARHTFESRTSGGDRLPVGGEVPVRYSPDDPGVARIDVVGRRISQVAFPLLVGAVFLTLGILEILGLLPHSGGGPQGR
ncbi:MULTISPECIES: DUF3592 domain-containing protein [unclassified Streptomyces]|uniref:DUF3592 domain-containing protein n=1 Tax=unclassified Streptomyces TaxID=2593676 RepID=UPI00382DA42D